MTYPTYCLTNRNHHWLLPGFCYQADKYWPDHDIIVASYGGRPAELPKHWRYRRIDKTNYPASRWTDGLKKLCGMIEAKYFTLILEDYWLVRPVKTPVIEAVERYLEEFGGQHSVLRVDLSADRASKKQARPFATLHDPVDVQLISTPPHTPYQMSFATGIWNTDLLRAVLKPHENPWQTEIDGSKRLARRKRPLTVLGTTAYPVKYNLVYRSHKKLFTTRSTGVDHAAVIRTKFPKGTIVQV